MVIDAGFLRGERFDLDPDSPIFRMLRPGEAYTPEQLEGFGIRYKHDGQFGTSVWGRGDEIYLMMRPFGSELRVWTAYRESPRLRNVVPVQKIGMNEG